MLPVTADPKANEGGDPPKEEGQQGDGTTQPTDQEKAFWSKIDERIDAGIQRGVEKFFKQRKETGTSRNGGRTTLPGIIADIMGGPFARDKQE